MTTVTPAAPAQAGYLTGQVWATVRWQMRAVVYLALWFWGLAVVVVTAATIVVANVGEVNNSILAFARQGAIWFPFSVFIGVTSSYASVHVAAGLTRRSLALGSIVTSGVAGLLYGVVFSVLLLVERMLYDAAGWRWRFVDDLSAGAGPETFIPALLFTFATAYLSGVLVGMAYLRGGGWWGTLSLPLTVGPILLVSAMFSADAGPIATEAWFGGRGVSVPIATAFSLLVLALMSLAFYRLTRGFAVPVRAS